VTMLAHVAALLALLTVHAGSLMTAGAAEKKIAVMWVGNKDPVTGRISRDVMSSRVNEGFLSRIRQIAPDMEIALRPDLADYQEAEKLFRKYEASRDGIVFMRSEAARFMGKARPKIPSFVGGCNNPEELGAIRDMSRPEGNITGVTYYLPYAQRFEVVKALFPDVKTVGLLVQADHPGGELDRAGTRAQCQRLGWGYEEVIAANVEELIRGLREIVDACDLIIVSNTGLVMDNTVAIVGITNVARKPVFSYAEKPVRSGAVAGLAARDEYLGNVLADSVVDVVVRGKPVSEVPVKMDPDPKILIHLETMKRLRLTFPVSIMEKAELIK
jgi:putative tryptophan/tyrosine transport system substrate-binding protein